MQKEQYLIDAAEGVWGVGFTSRGARAIGTDGRIFSVQPNHALATDLGNTGEDPFCPFATVAAALALCEPNRGDVILVGGNDGWQYGGGSPWGLPITESVTCNVEGVRIIGVSADPLGVPWTPAANAGTALTITALGVEVAGFLFMGRVGTETGISCVWDGLTTFADNPHIHHCSFDENLLNGILLEYVWNGHFHDLDMLAPDYGFYCAPLGSGFDWNRIERVDFRGCVLGAINATGGCSYNIVRDCLVYNADALAGAAATNEGFDFTGGINNVVENCSFTCLLPVPANGDFSDLNSAAATDCWLFCHCTDGNNVANP